MKLRHKKPLNSYKGQTNNDKNEFNDDDFRQQSSPLKRTTNPNNEQMNKYARILAKFIKGINEDYQEYQAGLQEHQTEALQPTNKEEQSFVEPEKQKKNGLTKREQIKQQQQITKLQSKLQIKEEAKDVRNNQKRKQGHQSLKNSKQYKPVSQNTVLNDQMSYPTQSLTNIMPKDNNFDTRNIASRDSKNTSHQMPNQFVNLGFPIGNIISPDMNNFANFPANINSIMNQNQLVSNMANFSQLDLSKIYSTYGLNSLNLNSLYLNYMNFPQNGHQIYNGLPINQKINKPIESLFTEQVKTFKNDKLQNTNTKSVYPLKRSAYHVAIAYKIYLDQLKKQGNNFECLDDIDPTKNARKIKNQNQNQNKNKKKK